MNLAYHVVDVFTSTPLEGNALAVFPDGSGLDTNTMQRIAREMNLSETTFIIPGESRDGATRVRIFTPGREMAFAGHPTVGTAYVMRRLGIVPADVAAFELLENVGRVRVRVDRGDDPMLWLTNPIIRDMGALPRDLCAAALNLAERDLLPDIPCEIFSAGVPISFIPLKDPDTVDRATPNAEVMRRLTRDNQDAQCFFPFAPTASGAYSRMFAPEFGIVEDPATGGATGPLAAFMMKHGLALRADGTRLVSEQGKKMGRRSLLHVLVHGESGSDGIEVGGHVVAVASAMLTL
jgi:trans-2,3-dihydro-3-hydroxyanthranilate isomerase